MCFYNRPSLSVAFPLQTSLASLHHYKSAMYTVADLTIQTFIRGVKLVQKHRNFLFNMANITCRENGFEIILLSVNLIKDSVQTPWFNVCSGNWASNIWIFLGPQILLVNFRVSISPENRGRVEDGMFQCRMTPLMTLPSHVLVKGKGKE